MTLLLAHTLTGLRSSLALLGGANLHPRGSSAARPAKQPAVSIAQLLRCDCWPCLLLGLAFVHLYDIGAWLARGIWHDVTSRK